MCRREEISCLFQSAEELNGTHQVLELKESQGCRIWQLNKKSHVSIQDISFVAKKEFNKEKFEIVLTPIGHIYKLSKIKFITIGSSTFISKASKESKMIKADKNKENKKKLTIMEKSDKNLKRLGNYLKKSKKKKNESRACKLSSVIVKPDKKYKARKPITKSQKKTPVKYMITKFLDYIKRNQKTAIAILCFCILAFGVSIGTPSVINHLKVKNQIETKKERFIN